MPIHRFFIFFIIFFCYHQLETYSARASFNEDEEALLLSSKQTITFSPKVGDQIKEILIINEKPYYQTSVYYKPTLRETLPPSLVRFTFLALLLAGSVLLTGDLDLTSRYTWGSFCFITTGLIGILWGVKDLYKAFNPAIQKKTGSLEPIQNRSHSFLN